MTIWNPLGTTCPSGINNILRFFFKETTKQEKVSTFTSTNTKLILWKSVCLWIHSYHLTQIKPKSSQWPTGVVWSPHLPGLFCPPVSFLHSAVATLFTLCYSNTPGMLLPQGLCTCCSLCLEYTLSPHISPCPSITAFRSLLHVNVL